MRERKTHSTGILLTPSQRDRLHEMAEAMGRKPNYVIGQLIESAKLVPVQTFSPVATLAVGQDKSAVNPAKNSHGAFVNSHP